MRTTTAHAFKGYSKAMLSVLYAHERVCRGLCLWRKEGLVKEALLPLSLAFYANISDHKKLFLNLQMSNVHRKWVNGTN